MDIQIREATIADFPAVFSLMQEFAVFQKTPEKLLISLAQMERDAHLFKCLVVETEEREVIGFASFFYAYYSWSGKALYLDDLYVQAPFRKYKIGTRLLNKVIALATETECVKVKWLVSKWNEHAIAFYKKMGATLDDTDMICDLYLPAALPPFRLDQDLQD